MAWRRSQLYDHAVRMMVQSDAYRGRLQGDGEKGWTLGTLRCVAFWNQFRGARSQSWEEFVDLGSELAALRQHVDRGMLPLVESTHGHVQFAHLSYQEFLAADFLRGAWAKTDGDTAWLHQCAGNPWWSGAGGGRSGWLEGAERGSMYLGGGRSPQRGSADNRERELGLDRRETG